MTRLAAQPLVFTVAGLALAGCGDPMATGEYAPPYATLNGQVVYSLLTPPVSIVLLWYNDRMDDASYAGQLGSVQKDIGTFTVGLDALPPAHAIHSGGVAALAAQSSVDPDLRFADATLLAFEDRNGNGQFDLVPDSSQESPDRVLGAATAVDLFFLASGQPADPAQFLDLLPTTSGFSLVQRATTRLPTFGDCSRFDDTGHFSEPCQPFPLDPAQALPLTTSIQLSLSNPPDVEQQLQSYSCATYWGLQDNPDTILGTEADFCDGGDCKFCVGYQCPLDVPPADAQSFSCNADNTMYVYVKCTPDPSRCGTRFCHYGHGERLPTDPIPPGWPCN